MINYKLKSIHSDSTTKGVKMNNKSKKLDQLVFRETRKITRIRPNLGLISLSYSENSRGTYMTKLQTRIRRKTIILKDENRCPEISIRKIFNKLTRVLNEKKPRRHNRLVLSMKEVA
jgi:hypothetical protein